MEFGDLRVFFSFGLSGLCMCTWGAGKSALGFAISCMMERLMHANGWNAAGSDRSCRIISYQTPYRNVLFASMHKEPRLNDTHDLTGMRGACIFYWSFSPESWRCPKLTGVCLQTHRLLIHEAEVQQHFLTQLACKTNRDIFGVRDWAIASQIPYTFIIFTSFQNYMKTILFDWLNCPCAYLIRVFY